MPAFVRIIWKVVFDALWHFSEDDGWAMASHVALSSLMAVFPFLIFGTALASFLGADQFAQTAVHRSSTPGRNRSPSRSPTKSCAY